MIREETKLKRVGTSIFSIACILFILLGGSAALLWNMHQNHHTKASTTASTGNIIGPPSLPAATVDTIFARMGSPMVGTGKVVEQASRQTNIDDAFALGVWWTETNDGAAGVGRADRNPGSVRGTAGFPAAFDGYTIYPSYSAAIIDWFSLLKSRYVSRGLTSAYTICYPYVGTSSASLWAGKVVNLMYRYRSEAPPPPKPQLTVVPTLPTLPPYARNHKIAHPQTNLFQYQVTQGEIEEQLLPGAPTIPQTQNKGTGVTTSELLLVVFGLLAALAIALSSLAIGREKRAVVPITTTHYPFTAPLLKETTPLAEAVATPFVPFIPLAPLTPLPFNQFSPLLERSTEEQEVPQLAFPVPTPTLVGARREGGLLSRYGSSNTEALPPRNGNGNTEALSRRLRLVPSQEIQA